MNLKIIITVLGGAVYLFLALSYFFRRKFVTLNAGKKLLPLPGNIPLKSILILLVGAAMIAVIPLRNFAPYLNVVFIVVACFAAEMAVRDLMVANNAGVYEKKILYGTYSYFFEEIDLLPTLAYEDDPETTQVDKRFLKMILKNGTQLELGFVSEEERNSVVKVMLEQAPELKGE